jgi:pyruvate formate-lyase activating enzyme-like uncharacterized protein
MIQYEYSYSRNVGDQSNYRESREWIPKTSDFQSVRTTLCIHPCSNCDHVQVRRRLIVRTEPSQHENITSPPLVRLCLCSCAFAPNSPP